MEQMAHIFPTPEPKYMGLTEIQTTLHDLIEAISEEVETGEDRLVAEIVLDMLEAGRIKFSNPMGKLTILGPCL